MSGSQPQVSMFYPEPSELYPPTYKLYPASVPLLTGAPTWERSAVDILVLRSFLATVRLLTTRYVHRSDSSHRNCPCFNRVRRVAASMLIDQVSVLYPGIPRLGCYPLSK